MDERIVSWSLRRWNTMSGYRAKREIPGWTLLVLDCYHAEKYIIYVNPGTSCPKSWPLFQELPGYVKGEIVAYIAVQTEDQARQLEKYFKTGSGKAILRKRILADGVR